METENIPVDDLKTEAEVKEVIEDKKPEEVKVVKKRHGKEEKLKKKEDKNVEQILRNLGNSANTEEKLIALCRKYSEISDENRKLSINSKQNDKKLLQILKENEQVQSEKSKLILQKSRLESLCRELQKQNKSLKEESLLKVREEEEKRKEVSDKFQSTLSEINVLMTEANGKNEKLFQDNIKMEGKFKTLLDEMHLREQRFEDMRQMMNKELEIAKATLAKVSLEMTEEKETLLKDKNVLLIKLSEYQNRIKELQSVETNLRSQVSLYTDKYNEFQTALSKSNEIFNGFNKEMEKMTKKIVKLEKETSHWKSRWEKSHSALLEMASDKQIRDAENLMLNKKCSKLQELCKTFQQERAKLIAQLKEYETGVPAIEGNKTDEINNGTLNQNGSAVTANSEMPPKPICPKFDLNSKTTRPKFDSKPCCPKSTCTKSEITHKFTCPKSELNSMCTKMKNNSKLISKESSKNKIIKTAAQCEKNLLESKIDKCNSQETNNSNNIKLEEPILKEDSSLINNVNIVESMNQLKCSDNNTVDQQIKTTVPENNVAPLLSDNPPVTNTES